MKKAIPIGVSSYQKLRIEDYYTVDKSAMIAEFLERKNNGNSDYTAKTFW